MGVALTEFRKGDVFLEDHDNEVVFRYEKKTGFAYRAFYGQAEAKIPNDNELYRQAILSGNQITAAAYKEKIG